MKRRVLGMLAAAALGLTAVVGIAPAASAVPSPDGAPYVALGDSVAAGTGNLPYSDPGCERSKRAYPALLGMVSFACTGWTTGEVAASLSEPMVQAALGTDTQVVTLTVGINDTGWQDIIDDCYLEPDLTLCAVARGTAAQVLGLPPFEPAPPAISPLAGNIADLVAAIRAEVSPTTLIVVTGYPGIFGEVSGSCSIGSVTGQPIKVPAADALEANGLVLAVNAQIATGIGAYVALTSDPNVVPVDVDPVFAGHRLCDSGDRWISGLVNGQKNASRSLHPNAAGQQAYAWAIQSALIP